MKTTKYVLAKAIESLEVGLNDLNTAIDNAMNDPEATPEEKGKEIEDAQKGINCLLETKKTLTQQMVKRELFH